jgi:hypothetical protein
MVSCLVPGRDLTVAHLRADGAMLPLLYCSPGSGSPQRWILYHLIALCCRTARFGYLRWPYHSYIHYDHFWNKCLFFCLIVTLHLFGITCIFNDHTKSLGRVYNLLRSLDIALTQLLSFCTPRQLCSSCLGWSKLASMTMLESSVYQFITHYKITCGDRQHMTRTVPAYHEEITQQVQ